MNAMSPHSAGRKNAHRSCLLLFAAAATALSGGTAAAQQHCERQEGLQYPNPDSREGTKGSQVNTSVTFQTTYPVSATWNSMAYQVATQTGWVQCANSPAYTATEATGQWGAVQGTVTYGNAIACDPQYFSGALVEGETPTTRATFQSAYRQLCSGRERRHCIDFGSELVIANLLRRCSLRYCDGLFARRYDIDRERAPTSAPARPKWLRRRASVLD